MRVDWLARVSHRERLVSGKCNDSCGESRFPGCRALGWVYSLHRCSDLTVAEGGFEVLATSLKSLHAGTESQVESCLLSGRVPKTSAQAGLSHLTYRGGRTLIRSERQWRLFIGVVFLFLDRKKKLFRSESTRGLTDVGFEMTLTERLKSSSNKSIRSVKVWRGTEGPDRLQISGV